MVALTNIEENAMKLTDNERALLARKLLESLPPNYSLDDEIEEAARRDAELEADPSMGMTQDELRKSLGR